MVKMESGMVKKEGYTLRCLALVLWLMVSGNAGMGQKVGQQVGLRGVLSSALSQSGFQLSPNDLSVWKAKQKERYLAKIRELPDSVRAAFAARADKALSFDWPPLPASLYLDYKRTGNRTRYEQRLNERRDNLNSLVIGELVTGDKKYLTPIVNGLWTTLEESTWEIPAIIGLQKAGTDLPDPSEQIIGLVSAETAAMVADIQYMLCEQLDSCSPVINKRIAYELHRRILDPYLRRSDLWWMGAKGQAVNNWNAWINTNILQVTLLAETDPDRLRSLMEKVFGSADHFIDQYPKDGGCDEGPSYWSIAGGKLIGLLWMANSVSGGKLSWASNELLHNMGRYIYKVHIAGDYFVNFADASPRTIPRGASVYGFGKMFDDDTLRQFGAYLFALNKKEIPGNNIVDFLETVEVYDQLTGLTAKAPLPAVSFLPDLQVMTARSVAASTSGLFLAVQGGNNGESHNHNDVGNFLIYADGRPVIVDAGVGTYTAQTFSSRRYELWNMQSQWHNCPVINGVMQKDGKGFRATHVSFEEKDGHVVASMDLSAAYPPAAFVRQWKRKFIFDRDRNRIMLSDGYSFEKRTGPTTINFLSSCEIKTAGKGTVVFCQTDGRPVLRLKYAPGTMSPLIEETMMDDEKLIGSWGKKLYRVSFAIDPNVLKGESRFVFSQPASN
ncbi:MAG TPA: heparinase II/III family protein [Puia sp.]